MFLKIGVLKSFEDFSGKRLCWSLFSIKLQALSLRLATLLKRDSNTGVRFPVKFSKFLRTSSSAEHLQWLLLLVKEWIAINILKCSVKQDALKKSLWIEILIVPIDRYWNFEKFILAQSKNCKISSLCTTLCLGKYQPFRVFIRWCF